MAEFVESGSTRYTRLPMRHNYGRPSRRRHEGNAGRLERGLQLDCCFVFGGEVEKKENCPIWFQIDPELVSSHESREEFARIFPLGLAREARDASSTKGR